jgi:hypothetical protein
VHVGPIALIKRILLILVITSSMAGIASCGLFSGVDPKCASRAKASVAELREAVDSYLNKSLVASVEVVDQCSDSGDLPYLVITLAPDASIDNALVGLDKSPWKKPTKKELPGFEDEFESVLYLKDGQNENKILMMKENFIKGEPAAISVQFAAP